MTDSGSDEISEIRELVRSCGLRCTSARISVLQYLRQANSPLSHAEIADSLAPQGLDKATVFRNLIDLSDAGLLRRNELGDHVWRFEVRDPRATHNDEHPHFVCIDCGSVTCLDDAEFDSATKRWATDIGTITEVLLKGHCSQCQ